MNGMSLMFHVRRGDAEAVIRHLRAMVWSLSEPYFLPDGDRDDVLQAARWGLAKAVRDWDVGKAARDGGRVHETNAFLGFARLCITRELVTAVKTATRAKHSPLNDAARLDKPKQTADGVVSLHELFFREMDEPPHVVIALEEARAALRALHMLTPVEREAIRRCEVMGERYDALGIPTKRVDNAMQRARRKLAQVPEPWTDPRALRAVEPEFGYSVRYLCRTAHVTPEAAERTAHELGWGRVLECTARRLLDGVDMAPAGRPRADGRRGVPVWRLRCRTLERVREAA